MPRYQDLSGSEASAANAWEMLGLACLACLANAWPSVESNTRGPGRGTAKEAFFNCVYLDALPHSFQNCYFLRNCQNGRFFQKGLKF